jgi:hypothetical protein
MVVNKLFEQLRLDAVLRAFALSVPCTLDYACVVRCIPGKALVAVGIRLSGPAHLVWMFGRPALPRLSQPQQQQRQDA